MKRILVTGGAGYIGSITIKAFLNKGYEVVAIDNLSNGYRENVTTELIVADLKDRQLLKEKIKGKFDAVVHFAAYALAGESMVNPEKYFINNVSGGIALLELMRECAIKNIVFSSSCSIFGDPESIPVTEDLPKHPESVYGETKLMFERILYWYENVYGIKYINLRYFNAAGASFDGVMGEKHNPETHIIPNIIRAALGEIEAFTLYGTDYPTKDGTCIRDYIHVEDLATAHVLAIEKLITTQASNSYNLGSGTGYSNLELIKKVEEISGKEIPVIFKPRRPGDPPLIYANIQKAKDELGFVPVHSDLNTIITSAWKWHAKNNKNENSN